VTEAGPEGRILTVVRAPAAVLASPARDVDPLEPDVVQLAADLPRDAARVAGVRRARGGPGGAWPCGWFSVDVTGHPKTQTCHGAVVLCNAVVVEGQPVGEGPGGVHVRCPDLTGDVKRAGRLVVRGVVPGTGAELTVTTDAFEARHTSTRSTTATGCSSSTGSAGPCVHPRRTYR
jgi:peptide deformylase